MRLALPSLPVPRLSLWSASLFSSIISTAAWCQTSGICSNLSCVCANVDVHTHQCFLCICACGEERAAHLLGTALSGLRSGVAAVNLTWLSLRCRLGEAALWAMGRSGADLGCESPQSQKISKTTTLSACWRAQTCGKNTRWTLYSDFMRVLLVNFWLADRRCVKTIWRNELFDLVPWWSLPDESKSPNVSSNSFRFWLWTLSGCWMWGRGYERREARKWFWWTDSKANVFIKAGLCFK